MGLYVIVSNLVGGRESPYSIFMEVIMEKENPETADKYQNGGSFTLVKGKKTYQVNVFFNTESKISIEEKIKRMIREDVKNGNF